jgi:hypothetical protein
VFGEGGATPLRRPGLGAERPHAHCARVRVFLDFEASSLGKRSYPIEVAWVFEDGRAESHLIRPLAHWTDWAADAQATHGIAPAQLMAEGEPAAEVARRMLDQLTGHALYASAPSWDGKWLSVLLRGAGLPRHALRLQDTDAAHLDAACAALREAVPRGELHGAARAVLARVRRDREGAPVAHRALADAQAEHAVWLAVRRAAEDEARTRG